MGSEEESQNKHTNPQEGKETGGEQYGNAAILSILSLGGIVIFSLPLSKP